MTDHQIHFGRKFYQDKKTGYWISTDYPRIRAHVWVWNNHWGKIPKFYHIHHKDENKSNNKIENLELIERSRHLSIHSSTPEKKQWFRAWAEKIRPLTKEWHRSAEGLAWHKYHAEKCKFGKWDPIKFTCEVCNKEFESRKISGTKFCSNNCKSKSRRNKGLDDIKKRCPTCHKEFISNKYSKTIYCSRLCVNGLTKEKYDVAYEMRKKGATYQEIASFLKIGRQMASTMLKKMNNPI